MAVPRTWSAAVTVLALLAGAVAFTRFGPYVGLLEQSQPYGHGYDDLVVRVDVSPGTGTLETYFARQPRLLVSGDGTAYAARDDRAGIVQRVVTFRVGEHGVQELLKRAHHDGLLAGRTDFGESEVLDGGETTVDLVTGRGRWRHRAYALEPGWWGISARGRLADFVGAALAVADRTGTLYRPPALRVMAEATPVPKPSYPVGRWPEDASIGPEEIGTCRIVDDPAVVRALTTRADQLYRTGATTYEVAAAVQLPGDSCAPDDDS